MKGNYPSLGFFSIIYSCTTFNSSTTGSTSTLSTFIYGASSFFGEWTLMLALTGDVYLGGA
jgi:hypothetical protein